MANTTLKVIATAKCFYGGKLRRVGETFMYTGAKAKVPSHMKVVEAKAK